MPIRSIWILLATGCVVPPQLGRPPPRFTTDSPPAGAAFMPSVDTYGRGEAERSLRAHGFTGEIVFVGATAPDAWEPYVCKQTPAPVAKVDPATRIELALCARQRPASSEPIDLTGLAVADATKRARAAGYTGEIEVAELSASQAGCANGTVCMVTPTRWNLNLERRMQLWVNRTITVTLPD